MLESRTHLCSAGRVWTTSAGFFLRLVTRPRSAGGFLEGFFLEKCLLNYTWDTCTTFLSSMLFFCGTIASLFWGQETGCRSDRQTMVGVSYNNSLYVWYFFSVLSKTQCEWLKGCPIGDSRIINSSIITFGVVVTQSIELNSFRVAKKRLGMRERSKHLEGQFCA